MSERKSQMGCPKHGPYSVCGHTDATCPDIEKANLGHGISHESAQAKGEYPKKDEWVEVSTESISNLALNLQEEFEQKVQENGFIVISSPVNQIGHVVVRDTLKSVFKNGLKEKEDDLVDTVGGFDMRFVDPPSKILTEDRVVMATAYELSVYLKPRYQKDGDSGDYDFRFIIKAKLMTDKDLDQRGITDKRDKHVHVTTVADKKSRMKAQERVAEARKISRVTWEDAKRNGILNVMSGGLPGLGKKK